MQAEEIRRLAALRRADAVTMIHNAASGHTGGTMSAMDALCVLFYDVLRLRPAEPNWPQRDRFLLSKGHCVEGYYAILADLGFFDKKELRSFCRKGSRLIGHPSNAVPGVEVCTGALGHGLPIGVGAALLSYFHTPRPQGRPHCLLLRTVKGKGLPFAENRKEWQGPGCAAVAGSLPRFARERRGHSMDGWKAQAARAAFTKTLLELAEKDPTLFAVATDSRGSVTLTDFAAALPNQFVECGIAEQDAVGIAAGLANAGLRPFVCGPASFLSLRAAEPIKVDVGYSRSNVKIVGVSGGVSYGALGSTHHATQDIALLRAVPGLEIFLPADAVQTALLTRYLAASDRPAYVRMGRGPVPTIYGEDARFVPGRANCLRRGRDAALIACGEMVAAAVLAADALEASGLSVSVYDMHTLRPLDEETILEAAETGFVVTAEEHDVHGGLGAAVAEALSQRRPTHMRILGLPDEKLFSGASADVFDHYGLTPAGIAAAVREGLKI